jgi:hypothetical protein
MRSRILLAVLACVLACVSSAQAARFTKPVKLVGAVGGEPSIATDPSGDVFVDGPQGIPSGLSGHSGVGFWISRNDGNTFGPAKVIGSDLGGGDSDVLYSKGAVYIADFEAVATQICRAPTAARRSPESGRSRIRWVAPRSTAARRAHPTIARG